MNDEHEIKKFNVFDSSYALPYRGSHSRTKDDILIAATVLFARKGYAAVSMKEIADAVDIQAASLYNHFAGKETLWKAVLDHAKDLYLLYFKHMEEQIERAGAFEEALRILFEEPEKMTNTFTCYAFALVQAEQFRDEYASDFYSNFLLKYAIDFVKERLDTCVAKGLAPAFDTLTVANMYSHAVLIGINISVQKLLGRPIPFESGEMLAGLRRFILDSVKA